MTRSGNKMAKHIGCAFCFETEFSCCAAIFAISLFFLIKSPKNLCFFFWYFVTPSGLISQPLWTSLKNQRSRAALCCGAAIFAKSLLFIYEKKKKKKKARLTKAVRAKVISSKSCDELFLFFCNRRYLLQYHGKLQTWKLGKAPITVVPNSYAGGIISPA